MTEAAVRRTGLIAAGICFVGWIVAVLYLVYRVFVVGLSPAQQDAAAQFSRQPLEALSEPLFAMLGAAGAVGVCIVASVLYVGYAQWRAARRRRLALEPDLE